MIIGLWEKIHKHEDVKVGRKIRRGTVKRIDRK